MLYKKYHRNLVKQFKKGCRIKLGLDKAEVEILSGPSIDKWWQIFIKTEPFLDRLSIFVRELTVVFEDGRLNNEFKYIHVIQKIS